MSRPLRYLVILLSSAIGLAVLAVLLLNQRVDARLAQVYQVPGGSLTIPSDQQALERGEHLVRAVYLCELCHGEDLGGQLQFDDPLSGQIVASNLTTGRGGVGALFTAADWERAIRHGVTPEGRPLIEMPSNTFTSIADQDLAAIVGYLLSLPPVDRQLPQRQLGPLYRISVLLDPSLIPAEVIDHTAPRPPAPEPGITAEYGRYLTRACTICHGENLAGGTSAGAGLDLTSTGNLPDWSEPEFRHALRTGERPRGAALDPKLMPWQLVGKMTDAELAAVWMYLQTLTPGSGEG
jgi:mono/diheme cytochrome c family protein